MNRENLRNLASDKLYILAYIMRRPAPVERTALTAEILREGRINYFFLCQYIAELSESGLLAESQGLLYLTEEGERILTMFSQNLDAEDLAQIEKPRIAYDLREENGYVTVSKTEDGALKIALTLPESEFYAQSAGVSEEILIEAVLAAIEKADS